MDELISEWRNGYFQPSQAASIPSIKPIPTVSVAGNCAYAVNSVLLDSGSARYKKPAIWMAINIAATKNGFLRLGSSRYRTIAKSIAIEMPIMIAYEIFGKSPGPSMDIKGINPRITRLTGASHTRSKVDSI